MKQPADATVTLKKLAEILFRRKKPAILCFCGVLALTVLVTLLTPRRYQSQAQLFVRLGRENVTLDPTSTLGQGGTALAVPSSREEEINSVIEILQSRTLLEEVVNVLGSDVILGRKPFDPSQSDREPQSSGQKDLAKSKATEDRSADPDQYAAIQRLASRLTVYPTKKSTVIHISYEASSPELARAVVARLIDAFLAQHGSLHRTPGGYAFLGEQAQRVKKDLQEQEDAYRRLKEKTGLYSAKEQREGVVKQIDSLHQDLLQTQSSLAAAQVEVKFLKKKLTELPSTQITAQIKGMPNPAADNLRAQLYGLLLKQKELRAKYSEKHPELTLIAEQIDEAKRILADEEKTLAQTTTGPNKAYDEAELALLRQETLIAALQAKAPILETQLLEQTARLKALDENTVALDALKREIELHEYLYRKYSENLEQGLVDQSLNAERISNISIVQSASYENAAVRPRWLFNIALGLLLALGASLALAIVLDRADATAKSPQEASSRLQLPTLASLSRIPEGEIFQLHDGGRLTIHPELSSALQQLLVSLPWQNSKDGPALQTLGITASQADEGTSSVSLGLALTAAAVRGQKVLLIDCQPESSRLADLLGVKGLMSEGASCGNNRASILPVKSVPGLCYLQAGSRDFPSQGTISVPMLEELKKEFSLLVLDMPPLASARTTPLLASQLDGTLLVVEAERALYETLQQEKSALEAAHARIVGIVLNKRRHNLPRWLERLI